MNTKENWDACHGEVTVRKSALIDLAANAIYMARCEMEELMRDVCSELENGIRCLNKQDVAGEYHWNCNAYVTSSHLEQVAKKYHDAVNAYYHLRMIDTEGENRTLKLID